MAYNFDRVHDKYDATRGFPPGVAERISRWVLSRLPKDPAITEIGVGTGRIAVPFIEQNIRYTGFDISAQMTGRLREKLGGDLRRAQICLTDITEPLPLPEESQDAVIAVHILHLVDALATLRQSRRILKPHGAWVWGYQLHDDLSPRQEIRSKFREFAGMASDYRPRDFYVPEARALLAQWGSQVSQHVVATWTETDTYTNVIAGIGERLMSFTWSIEEAVLQQCVLQTEAWARERYGDDLAQPFPVEQRFLVDWYQF